MRNYAVRAVMTAPILVLAAFAAALPSSASAAAEIQAVTAPIGSTTPSAYTITIQNNGETTEGATLITFDGAPQISGVVPSTCAFNQPVAGAIGCPALAAGQTLQVCWVGPAPTGVTFFSSPAPAVELTTYPPIGTCPVAGFMPPSSGGSGSGGGSGGNGSTGGGSAASKALAIGRIVANSKKGTATLTATVSGPGTLKLSGKGVKGATVKAKAAGAVKLTVKAAGAAATTLAKTGKVTLQAKVTFAASGGKTTTLSRKVKLKRG